MKIAIVSRHDPTNVSAWSGTPFFITREIQKISDDVTVVRATKMAWILALTRVLRYVFKKFGSSLDLSVTNAYSRAAGREIQKKLEHLEPDVVVGIAASPELANVKSRAPILHISDATFAVMTDYYPEMSQVPRWLWREANEIEHKVIENSSYSIFPSQWALDSAQKDYSTNLDKLKLIRLGANVGALPTVTKEYLATKFNNRCNILFMGKDWGRKGGDIVLSAFEHILKTGVDAHLYIVGCDPFLGAPPKGVTVYASIQKSDPRQFELYNKLFSEASLFVLPTQAEAYGLVFAEAAAFATPVIAPATGGIPSVVDDGKSGLLLPLSADGKVYAESILTLWRDKEKLHEMATYAHDKYVNELNWDKWRDDFGVLLENLQKTPPEKKASTG
ncbi:glycosyltransferase family 4 protein [Sneathiella sp. HT1-7]|uniref:glycosyltransferase family 4 protein n=1 Tax=Sneathiella sp. HT1-7 TaxID=2887192 RepID=UPI001D1460EE|nr:glycosyltransferase family 4 protein [Sneathiella sp. HT1-7]MCC3303872.1 glycosyltransferase family 4 protein [Sneathiella sp. HT1-7]